MSNNSKELFRCRDCREEFKIPQNPSKLKLEMYRVKHCPSCGNQPHQGFCSDCHAKVNEVGYQDFNWCPYCGGITDHLMTQPA